MLDTSIMTRIVNRLLIPSNINPNLILVIRSYVKSGRKFALTAALRSDPNVSFLNLQP